MIKRIAIIGSGASGLTAIKCCLDEGLVPVCFERTDHAGGLWYYTEKVKDGQSCVTRSTIINTSKENMSFSDFQVPTEYPIFMHNTKVRDYLKMYGESFKASKYTRFSTEVLRVKQATDFSETGQWIVEFVDHEKGAKSSEVFDGVMVCTGHHADKNTPKFEGLDQFQGKVLHTHDYRHPSGFENKRVLVIGIGNSGSDMVVELSRLSKQVYLSTRRGFWLTKRIGAGGLPGDMVVNRRYRLYLLSLLPRWLRVYLREREVNANFDHDLYGIKPKHHVDAQHPTDGDDLPNVITSGSALIKPDIRRFTTNGVEFVDGSKAEIDVAVLATGYVFGFPFIDHPALEVKDNKAAMYKFVFPPDIKPASLAIIGFVQPLGSIIPISELQCRWVTRVFKGLATLPAREEMWADVQNKQEAMRKRYVGTTRHTIQVDYTSYMDEIAELVGCRPDILKLFWRDPRLAMQCLFGPAVPYQYRLMGPQSWDGARDALMKVMERTVAGVKISPQNPRRQNMYFYFYVGVILIIAVIFKMMY